MGRTLRLRFRVIFICLLFGCVIGMALSSYFIAYRGSRSGAVVEKSPECNLMRKIGLAIDSFYMSKGRYPISRDEIDGVVLPVANHSSSTFYWKDVDVDLKQRIFFCLQYLEFVNEVPSDEIPVAILKRGLTGQEVCVLYLSGETKIVKPDVLEKQVKLLDQKMFLRRS